MSASFDDLPKDVLWLILQRVIIDRNEHYMRLDVDLFYWESTVLTRRISRFPSGHTTTAQVMFELSLISKRVRLLLKSKCQWKGTAWGFIKGSIEEAIAATHW
jgi:hypothetical protein